MDESRPPIDATDLASHAEALRRLARRLLEDAHAAEDVVQDALVVALEQEGARRGPVGPWLAGVVRNLSRLTLRGRSRRARRERLLARREPVPPAAEAVARMEIARRVVDAVSSLDEPYRTVVVLRFFDDLAPAEIAARLGCPVPTVRTRLRRALALLRGRLDRGHGDSRRTWALALLPLLRARAPGPRAAGVVAGGILMKKLAAVAALLLLLLLLGVTIRVATRDDGPDLGPGRAGPVAGTAAPPASPPGEVARAPDPTAGAPGAASRVPPPPDDVAEVVVLGPDDRPVAGATVTLFADNTGDLQLDRPKVAASGRTDATGRIRLPAVPYRRYLLKVSHPDLSTAGDVECFGGNVATFRLPAGGSIIGTVSDAETGHPIEGATVWVMDFAMCGVLAEWRVKTDADGRYRVDGLGRSRLNMCARAPEHAIGYPTVLPRTRGGEETVIDFRLSRGTRQALRVTDRETGRILPEVEVLCGHERVAAGRGAGLLTDPVRLDRGSLLVRAAGYLMADLGAEDLPPAGETADIRLTRGIPVRGRVLDETGAPVPGLSVRLLATPAGRPEETRFWTVTADDGWFETRGGDPGGRVRYEIDRPDGGVLGSPWIAVPRETPVLDLSDIELTPACSLTGRLLGPDGRPFPRAFVRLVRESDCGPLRHQAFVDPRGRFRIDGIPPGPAHLIVSGMLGFAAQHRPIDLRGDEVIVWALEERLAISGVVVHEDGSPVCHVMIQADHSGNMDETDDAGEFRIRGLGAGPYRVSLVHHREVAADEVPGDTRNLRLVLPR